MSDLINLRISVNATTAQQFAAVSDTDAHPLAQAIMRQKGGFDAGTAASLFLRPTIDGTERQAYTVYLDADEIPGLIAAMTATYADFTLLGGWLLDGTITHDIHPTITDYCAGEQVVLLAGQSERQFA